MFDVMDNGGATVDILNVPVFMAHSDRAYQCDEDWLDRCVADFYSQKAESVAIAGDAKYAMRPPITVGHTPESPDAPEPPSVGFVDNLRRMGKVLYADFCDVARETFQRMKAGAFPYRSAEVIPTRHRLTNVSLLGGRYPHFSLPVMRFQRQGETVMRYTMQYMGGPMPFPDQSQHIPMTPPIGDLQGMPAGVGGMDSPNGSPMLGVHQTPNNPVHTFAGADAAGAPGDNDMNQLAAKIAPLVAQILTEQQANAGNPQLRGAAYAADGKVEKYDEMSDAGKHTDQTADAMAEDSPSYVQDEESVAFDGDEMGAHAEDYTGTKLTEDSMTLKANASTAELKKYIKQLETRNQQQEKALQKLGGQVNQLHKHNIKSAQAAKRTMLRSKCREFAARGYAIGDKDQIERHVERMMPMDPEQIKGYIVDVFGNAPQVPMEKHTIHDVVERPGGPADENERYFAEDSERLTDMGLNVETLRLADVLGE